MGIKIMHLLIETSLRNGRKPIGVYDNRLTAEWDKHALEMLAGLGKKYEIKEFLLNQLTNK